MPGGLLADLYELNMAASYLRRSMTAAATFSLFVRAAAGKPGLPDRGWPRRLPGLPARFLHHRRRAWLAGRSQGYDEQTLQSFRRIRFTGDVWAVPEGTPVFAGEPLLELTAEAQLAETAMLNHITFQTSIATKTARCVLAAGGARLVDFAFRRAQGIESGVAVARAATIGGFAATSNTEAARRYGLAASGTMAHSFVEAFDSEQLAFTAFAEDFPGNTTFLVDTYDTIGGVRAAIEVASKLRLAGPVGVRLDPGDLAALAFAARQLLDDAGLDQARIFASGGLDEYAIAALSAAGAPIDAYGVGTKMGVSADAPYLDTACKLVDYGGRPVMKLSAGKVTLPAAKQVYRGPAGDVISLREEPPPVARPLLIPVMRHGRRLSPPEPIAAASQRRAAGLDELPPETLALREPAGYPVTVSAALAGLQERLAHQLRQTPTA